MRGPREWQAPLATLMLGLAVIVIAHLASPLRSLPLYDGFVVFEPYVWLSPPPGEPGGAKGATESVRVRNVRRYGVIVATPEAPPQAQLYAGTRAFDLPADVRRVKVSIAPVVPAIGPSDGHILGNVYEILVTDQAGAPVTVRSAHDVNVILRAPDSTAEGVTLESLDDGVWLPLETFTVGLEGLFGASVKGFGEFALVGTSPEPSGDAAHPSPTATPDHVSLATFGPLPPTPMATLAHEDEAVSGDSTSDPLVLVGVLALISGLVFVLFIVLIRSRRRPRGHTG